MTKSRHSTGISTPAAENRRHSLNPSSPFEKATKSPKANVDGTPKLTNSAKKAVSKLKRPREDDEQSFTHSPEMANTESVKIKKSRAETIISSPTAENQRHSLNPSSPFERAAKSPKASGDGTPKLANSAKKAISKLKRPREDDEQSFTHSPEMVNTESVKLKKSRAETELSTTGKYSVADDPERKVLLLGMIRQRLASLDARTLFVRRLPKNTIVAHLKSLCPTSINARLQLRTQARRRKNAYVMFKTEQAAREALHSVNGKLIADRPIVAQLCSDHSSHIEGERSTESRSHPKVDQLQLDAFRLRRLHISCIPRSATQDEVKELFPKAVSLHFDVSGGNRTPSVCEARFNTEAEALDAFTTQHGSLLRGCPIIVNFAFKPRNPKRHNPTGTAKKATAASKTPKTNQSKVCSVPKLDRSPTHEQSLVITPPHSNAKKVKHLGHLINKDEVTKSGVKSGHISFPAQKTGATQPQQVNALKKSKLHPKKPKIKQIRLL